MSRVLPILYNTEMVQAILNNHKTATRRAVKGDVADIINSQYHKEHPKVPDKVLIEKLCRTPYEIGDVLYIRETWAFMCCLDCMEIADDPEGTCLLGKTSTIHKDKDSVSEGCYIYRADHPHPERITWRPSIHMPKAAARIWLHVTDVHVERLQEIKPADIKKEGLYLPITPEECKSQYDKLGALHFYEAARLKFSRLWDSTIRKVDHVRYGWAANPWVWVIEFERCEKPEMENV